MRSYLFTGPQGGLLRRGNFRQSFWGPAWDGNHASELQVAEHGRSHLLIGGLAVVPPEE